MEGGADGATIEDIVLRRDGRSMSALRPHLPTDFCTRAAQSLLDHAGPTLITTGFYILSCGVVETDGPPGAVAIGEALAKLGMPIAYVTDVHGADVMRGLAPDAEVIEFPIAGATESGRFAEEVRRRFEPTQMVAIERCSMTTEGVYRNMRSLDIGDYTANVDTLFELIADTVGIGDGGNEIGMGNLADEIRAVPALPGDPAATGCAHLVIASVSNWGGYGLVAALSRLAGRNLLPSLETEASWVTRSAEMGAVDGYLAKPVASVDGFALDDNSETLRLLHELLEREGVR